MELKAVEAKRRYLNPLEFFKPLESQEKIYRDKSSKTKIILGGNRASKTTTAAKYIIEEAIARKKIRIWATAETFPVSVNVQQRKVWDLIPKSETKYCYYDEINGFRNRKVTFKSGSIIVFKSYDQNREAFQADDIDIIWDDEEPPHDIYKEQRMRLVDRNGEMIITMTSMKGVTDLIQEIYEDADIVESKFAPLVGEDLPRIAEKDSIKIFTLWSTENPFVDQSRLAEEIKFMSKQEIKSRIYGIPTNLSGRIYPSFNKKIHVVPVDYIPKSHVCIWHVLDPHDRKPWAMQWWAVDKIGRAFCIREYPQNKNFNEMEFDDKTYADYAKVIREIEIGIIAEYGRSVSRRIIDPNFGNATERKAEREGGQSKTTPKQELKRLGLHYKDGIDSLEAGHLQVRKWLHYEEKDGQLIVKPKLFISEECPNTIRHLSRYSRKDLNTSDGDVKDNAKPMDKYKDYSDDTRYFVMANPCFIERNFVEPEEPTKKAY